MAVQPRRAVIDLQFVCPCGKPTRGYCARTCEEPTGRGSGKAWRPNFERFQHVQIPREPTDDNPAESEGVTVDYIIARMPSRDEGERREYYLPDDPDRVLLTATLVPVPDGEA